MDELVHYATTVDGVSIAYHALGEGAVPLVAAPAVPWSNIRAEMDVPFWRDWWLRLAEKGQVIRYDGRGTGLSDRAAVDFSLEAQVRDLEAVTDHLGLARFALGAPGPAAAAAVAYAARHPRRVSHLLLWNPCLNGADFYPAFETFERMAADYWTIFTESFAHSIFGWGHGELAHEYAAFLRSCVTQEAFLLSVPLYQRLDATKSAPLVRARTLVMSRQGMAPLNIAMARDAAARISGARLVMLEGASFLPSIGDIEGALALHTDFLAEDDTPGHGVVAGESRALTSREIEVLRLLAAGNTGKEIANALGVSLSTAQRHIANIYTKIGARSRVDAATYALSRGLIDPPAP